MKVLFVHLGLEHMGVEYLSAVLKREGHETALALDPGLFSINGSEFHNARLERRFAQTRRVLRTLDLENPDLAAFTVYTSTFAWAQRMAAEFKQRRPHLPIVFGGQHPTLEPERTLAQPHVDYIIRGQGEGALCDLAAALAQGEDPAGIPNLGHRNPGRGITLNPLRAPIEDLDALPLPDKNLFAQDAHFRDVYTVMSSRGCAHHCAHCCENALHGPGWRRRSPESVLHELEQMKARYKFREVLFSDPNLLIDRHWLETLLDGYRQRIRAPFRCLGQPALMTEDIALMLKHSACQCVEFGMQNVNQDLKRNAPDRTETNEQALNAFRICDSHGLPFDIGHMFGLPGESAADHARALCFYKPLRRLNRINTRQLEYFPGAPITQIALERGIISPAHMERIRNGLPVDLSHPQTPANAPVDKETARGFVTAMKLLPLMPRAATQWLAQDPSRAQHLARIPAPLVILLHAFIAILHSDNRFLLNIKHNALRLWRARGNTGPAPQ